MPHPSARWAGEYLPCCRGLHVVSLGEVNRYVIIVSSELPGIIWRWEAICSFVIYCDFQAPFLNSFRLQLSLTHSLSTILLFPLVRTAFDSHLCLCYVLTHFITGVSEFWWSPSRSDLPWFIMTWSIMELLDLQLFQLLPYIPDNIILTYKYKPCL
jgi:hypothetical protein